MSSSQVFRNSDIMDLVRAVQAMNQAYGAFVKVDSSERENKISMVLAHFQERITSNAEAIAENLFNTIGVPKGRARNEMVPTALELMTELRTTVQKISDAGDGLYPSAGHCAVFLGWTDPLVSFVRRVPVLFAAGNAVCLKPSRASAAAYDLIGKLWLESLEACGVDRGLFQILHGAGEGEDQIGELILRHPAMKSIYWIGRTQSALKARLIALQSDKRFFFSGSGRNPALIFPHPDSNVVETLIRQMADLVLDPHGLGPFRPSRFFIHESIYKLSLEIFADHFLKANRDDGLLVLPAGECRRFDSQVKLALSETGKLVTGGARDENRLQPTLIRDLTNCSTLQGEELAGPVMTAASFKYLHEALKYANTSPLGLSAYVLHPENEKRQSVAAKIEASRVIATPVVPRSSYLFKSVAAVKQSQSCDDGVLSVYRSSQWRSRLFV